MVLTPRQRQFREALVRLCRDSGHSVHYTAVAEALGVSPFSAYDMLKLLESKGVVASEYVLDGSAPGPGRSAIMFYPRSPLVNARHVLTTDEAEWRRVANRLLQRLSEAREANIREVVADLLGRLSSYDSPLSYCMGATAMLLLNLRLVGQGLLSRTQILGLVSAGELGLGALAGLSVGASLSRLREAPSSEALLQSARRFQEQVAALSTEGRQALAEFVGEALSALEASQA